MCSMLVSIKPQKKGRNKLKQQPRVLCFWSYLQPGCSLKLLLFPAPRKIKHQVSAAALGAKKTRARSLPGELCNLHKAEDIHVGSLGTPEPGGSVAPSHASKGSLSSPMARTSQCAWGLSGGSGWWRRPRRASTWRRWLLPPSGRELRVHPQAGPLMGARFGKTQWRRNQAGHKERGRGARPRSCAPP